MTGLMLEYMRDFGVAAAFNNRGGFRADIIVPEGGTAEITVGDIYAINPFNNTWLVYDLTGEELAQQLANGIADSSFGDQVSGLTYEYVNRGTEDKPDIEIVSITLSDGTSVDIHGTEPIYRVCTSIFCATLEGGVFEGKTPVFPEAEAPIDHEALIELLRGRRDRGEEHIPTDNEPRGFQLDGELENAA